MPSQTLYYTGTTNLPTVILSQIFQVGSEYVVAASTVLPAFSLWRSSDLLTWTEIITTGLSGAVRSIVQNGIYYVAVTNEGNVYRSTDLAAWTLVESLAQCSEIVVIEGVFLRATCISDTFRLQTSPTGSVWTTIRTDALTPVSGGPLKMVARAGRVLVVGVNDPGGVQLTYALVGTSLATLISNSFSGSNIGTDFTLDTVVLTATAWVALYHNPSLSSFYFSSIYGYDSGFSPYLDLTTGYTTGKVYNCGSGDGSSPYGTISTISTNPSVAGASTVSVSGVPGSVGNESNLLLLGGDEVDQLVFYTPDENIVFVASTTSPPVVTYPDPVVPSDVGNALSLRAGPLSAVFNLNISRLIYLMERLVDATLASDQHPKLLIDLNGHELLNLVSSSNPSAPARMP